MASNIITSDGKDLDSRYLAIGGKAASAARADTAGRADSAGHADSAGSISGGKWCSVSGNAVRIDYHTSWTAPSDGVLTTRASNASINGHTVASGSFPIKKGNRASSGEMYMEFVPTI